MLFVCLCVAGFLAGNRAGYREGYASGKAKRQSEDPYPKVYEVGDIIRATDASAVGDDALLEYQYFVDATQTSVFPDEWESLGGPCTMAPVPQLECLIINATSGVHDRLRAFFGDLSSVKHAVAVSRREQEDMRRRRDEWTAGMIQPASERLDAEPTLVSANIDLIGSWDVQRNTPDGMAPNWKFVFLDTDTVSIPTPGNEEESMDVWYFVLPGSVVIAGKPYIAATTNENALVLVPNDDPLKFLVATPADGEP